MRFSLQPERDDPIRRFFFLIFDTTFSLVYRNNLLVVTTMHASSYSKKILLFYILNVFLNHDRFYIIIQHKLLRNFNILNRLNSKVITYIQTTKHECLLIMFLKVN